MARFESLTFVGENINLDGNEYDACRFDNCTLTFSGGSMLLTNAAIGSDCRWVLLGPARETVAFMKAIYNLGGPPRVYVDALIAQIKSDW